MEVMVYAKNAVAIVKNVIHQDVQFVLKLIY